MNGWLSRLIRGRRRRCSARAPCSSPDHHLGQQVGELAGRHVAAGAAAQLVRQILAPGATEDARHPIAEDVCHLGDVFRARFPLLLDVPHLRELIDQCRDLLRRKRRVPVRVLHHDGAVEHLGDAVIHGDGPRLVGVSRRHGNDGIRASPRRCLGVQDHLGDGDAGAAEDDRQAPIHLFEDGVEGAQPLALAEKPELAHHYRPHDAVLAGLAAEVRATTQIFEVDLEVLAVRRGQQPEDATVVACAAGHVSNRRSGCQKSTRGSSHSSVGPNSPGVRRFSSIAG